MRGKIGLKKLHHLWWVAAIGGLLLFLTGQFFPKLIGYAMLLVVGFTFRMAYSAPVQNKIWHDLGAFVAILVESSLSSGFSILTCNYSQQACQPNVLRTQIFLNYFVPLIMFLLFWISMRLPVLIKRIRKWF